MLVVSPAAARDIAEAEAYYAEHRRSDAFLAAVDATFAQVAERPLMFPIAYRDVRRALLRRFPYSIFFLIEGDDAVVLAVHHRRRDPASRPAP